MYKNQTFIFKIYTERTKNGTAYTYEYLTCKEVVITPVSMFTKMIELPIKWRINIFSILLWSELLSLKCSEIFMYKRIHLELKNVHNVLGILLKTILKIKNCRLYDNFYSKNCRMLPVFEKLFGIYLGKENMLYIFLQAYNVVI